MGNFYFDLETTGLDPENCKIITIQYQELDRAGKPIGKLTILKEWESSEKKILEKFISETRISDPYPFSFVPVGFNLGFEHNFIRTRTVKNGLPQVDILSKPFIDLKSIGVLMNNGEFKGCGLDKLTGKQGKGSQVPIWYANKQFDQIIKYIEVEAQEFLRLNSWLCKKMPILLSEFKKELNK